MPLAQEPASNTAAARAVLIKARALQLGFSKVGIVRAEQLTAEQSRLEQWLTRGFHAEMKWMERDPAQRADPRRFWPAARSVVVVALNYYTPPQHSVRSDRAQTATGKVSRYAWGDDYHDVVGEKLSELLSWTKHQWSEADGKVCVDIQPVMDKAWGLRAGLGWIGKHTNVITLEHGSWVFIGELLLNLELEHDSERVEDHCGTCTLCIDACPTAAITEPYVVDSNKCISYATIELRAPELPAEMDVGGWLYGCDVCQDVCPWNRFEQPTSETRFAPREGNVDVELNQIMKLTPES